MQTVKHWDCMVIIFIVKFTLQFLRNVFDASALCSGPP